MTYQRGDIILNKYRIEAKIGQGAFAQVFLATHLDLKNQYALKVLERKTPGLGDKEYQNYQDRFMLEARLGARVKHPRLMRVFDFERDNGTLILVMEYYPGGSLANHLKGLFDTNQVVPLMAVVQITQDLADGLVILHANDIIHRDLHPGNILLDDKGRATIADLGLAQVPHGPSQRSALSQPIPHPGHPDYISPEQERSTQRLTPASDIYSLGIVLFQMLTGRFYKNVPPTTNLRTLRPDIPRWLENLLSAMLEPEPENRLWEAGKVSQEINRHKAELRGITPKEKRLFRRVEYLLLVIVLLMSVVLLSVYIYPSKFVLPSTTSQAAYPSTSVAIHRITPTTTNMPSLSPSTAAPVQAVTVTEVVSGIRTEADNTPATVTPVSPGIIFTDDFEDAQYTYEYWSPDGDGWIVVNGVYQCTRNGKSYAGDETWEDYILEVDVMGVEVIDKVVNFRYYDRTKAYGIDFRSAPYNDLVLVKNYPGLGNHILQSAAVTNYNNSWYSLKIILTGNKIDIFVNGGLLLSYTDTTNPVLSGRIGLGADLSGKPNSAVYFDNVKVTLIEN